MTHGGMKFSYKTISACINTGWFSEEHSGRILNYVENERDSFRLANRNYTCLNLPTPIKLRQTIVWLTHKAINIPGAVGNEKLRAYFLPLSILT